MAKKVKNKGKKTKDSIVKTALTLFTQKGYDSTSIDKIIEKLGISKGAFYHHFDSKNDLLDDVAVLITEMELEEIQPKIDREGLDAAEKINKYFELSTLWKAKNMTAVSQMLNVLLRDENIVLRQKIESRTKSLTTPFFAKVISQGVNEDIFHVSSPDETAELILHLCDFFFEKIMLSLTTSGTGNGKPPINRISRQVHGFFEAMERILGAKAGTLETHNNELFVDSVINFGSIFFKKK